MKKPVVFLSFIFCLVLFGCNKKADDETVQLHTSSLDLKAMADKIIEKAALQPGEVVFMIGKPNEFDSLIVLLEERFKTAGAVYLGTINVGADSWPTAWETDFVKSIKGKAKEEIVSQLAMIDLGIMLPGAVPADAPYGAWQEVLKQGKGRAIHFHWAGVFDLSTKMIAMDSLDDVRYQNAILKTDYKAITEAQDWFEKDVRNNKVVTVTTPGGSLSFLVGDRPITKQDGNASKSHALKARNLIDREVELPAGAIRLAPLEETVEGTMAFPDGMWDDQKVEGLVVTFTKGKITDIKATTGLDFVKSVLDPSKNEYMFREFALGFNPLLEIRDGDQKIMHYGYGAGAVRLSFGNNAELGGKVGGEFVKINLFTDATVTVGKEVWVENGRLTKTMSDDE